MKRRQKQQAADMTEEEIGMAFRRRIQSQALIHQVGNSVPEHVVMRFRKAGTWNASTNSSISDDFLSMLTQKSHPQRIPLPDGPLAAVIEDEQPLIIDVSECLVSGDPKIRMAALHHFADVQSPEDCWTSDSVLNLLSRNVEVLGGDDESAWIDAGLTLRDAINRDFRVNCAGLRQACLLQINETYQEYLRKVVRPRANCFNLDHRCVFNPTEEFVRIHAKFKEWSSLDDLGLALNRFLAFCGYLPLAGDLSAGSLIAAWQSCHANRDVWPDVWKWTESCPSVLAKYHAAHAFLEHPHWINVEEIETLLKVIRSVIISPEGDTEYPDAPLWNLRSILLQHYQIHLESTLPGLNGEVVATTACWMTEMVASLLNTDPVQIQKACKFLLKEVHPNSWKGWFIARSRMPLSPLRVASLYSSFIWSDSLLATAVRRFAEFPEYEGRDEYRKFLLTRLTSAICMGKLRTVKQQIPTYAFDLPVAFSDFGFSNSPPEDDVTEAARQVLALRTEVEGRAGLKGLLLDLRELPLEICAILCGSLRSWRVDPSNSDSTVQEFLNETDWRKLVFQRLPLYSLENLVSFLTDWQLQNNEEWLLRVPQILASECEYANEVKRKEMLFFATAMSALAADIASPVARLLVGSKKVEFADQFEVLRKMIRDTVGVSEPWVAARVRGFLGTLESVT